MTLRTVRHVFILSVALISATVDAIPYNNLFQPYDILLSKPIPCDRCLAFDVTGEVPFQVHAFQTDPEDLVISQAPNPTYNRKRDDVLQIWQDCQSFTAALQGTGQQSAEAIESYKLNIKGEAIADCLKPCADFKVPLNLMLAARYALPWDLTFGLYLPFYMMELKNVRWHEHKPTEATSYENAFERPVSSLEKIGNLNLRDDWKKSGIGDLAAILWWNKDFRQAKEWLKHVNVGLRGGFTFPTATEQSIDNLFALPFGYDGGTGLLFGGTIELGFGHHLKLGLDSEFLYLFGSQHTHRIKTDAAQTDLLLAHKALVDREPGFLQHYTVYGKLADFCSGFSGTLAYQHTKQNETRLIPNSALFDAAIINSAESLQDWTTHSVIGMLDYDFCLGTEQPVSPHISVFCKYGFNGKRALLFNSAGCEISIRF